MNLLETYAIHLLKQMSALTQAEADYQAEHHTAITVFVSERERLRQLQVEAFRGYQMLDATSVTYEVDSEPLVPEAVCCL